MKSVLIALSILILPAQSIIQRGEPRLSNGTITYSENGRRVTIALGRKVADLWVAPDQSVIAFVAIEKGLTGNTVRVPRGGPSLPLVGTFIQESSVYIAKRSDNFRPIRVNISPINTDRSGRVFREPSLSPDLKTLYFAVPEHMTTWTLMSKSLPEGPPQRITGKLASGYCVIWGGSHSGELLISIRYDGGVDPSDGIKYPCFLRTKSGNLQHVADEDSCWAFDEWARIWSKRVGGSCGDFTLDQDTR